MSYEKTCNRLISKLIKDAPSIKDPLIFKTKNYITELEEHALALGIIYGFFDFESTHPYVDDKTISKFKNNHLSNRWIAKELLYAVRNKIT